MGFLRRLFGAKSTTGSEPARIDTSPTQPDARAGRADPLDGFDLDPKTVAEAKLTMKELRLRKKELQAEKRQISAEAADQREAWRERQAGRYTTAGFGRGMSGRVVRSAIQGKRRSERLAHANALNEFADAKAEVDADIAEVEQAIIDLERYVLQETPRPGGGT